MASSSSLQAPAEQLNSPDNLELGPVLSILTEDQKNLLICRAIQKDPELAQHLLDMAAEPITPEEAASRVDNLDAAAAVQAVRSFGDVEGGEFNALTLLVALTETVRDALQALAEKGAEWQDSDELESVEALPPAGTVAALWKELLGGKAAEAAEADELRELLEETQGAAAGVRVLLPALLVGPEGPFDNFAAALELLPKPQKKSKKARTK